MTEIIQPYLPLLIWLVTGIILWGVVYALLPSVTCQINSRLTGAYRPHQPELDYSWLRYLPAPWIELLSKRLYTAGFFDRKAVATYVLALAGPPGAALLLAIISRGPLYLFLSAGGLLTVLVNAYVSQRIKKRNQAFQLCLYKIYRFLDLQLTAGVQALDVFKGLPEAIDQPLIRADFLRFTARLELTLDLDRALEELQLSFAGPDMNLLASQLRNSLQTGMTGQTFQRMENLLFNRHLSLIRAKSKHLRNELLLVALLALVPIEVLFIFPLVAQAMASLGQLYAP